jgi:arachidonate 5-lipoxygenase
LSESDILAALPDKQTTLDIMTVTKILSDKGTNSLGDFEVQYIFDPPAKKIVNE